MGELPGMGIALFAGALLGVFFFGGLWWTIHKCIASEWAAVWFIGSLLIRAMAVMAGFYFVSQHHWSRFAACLLGFLLARIIVVKWLGRDSATAVAKRGQALFVQNTRRASASQKGASASQKGANASQKGASASQRVPDPYCEGDAT